MARDTHEVTYLSVIRHRAAPLDALSFVAPKQPPGSGYNYWSVETTGDYSSDCEKGHELAAEYLEFLRLYPTNGNATLLQSIVASMIERATTNARTVRGIEVGFLQSINRAAMAGVTLVPSAVSGRLP